MGKAIEVVLLLIGILIITTSVTGLLISLGFDISDQIDLFSDRLEDREQKSIKIVSETIPGVISDPVEGETTIQIQNLGKLNINERNLFIQVDGRSREILNTEVVRADNFGEDRVLEVTFNGTVGRGDRIQADLGPKRAESVITTGPEDIDLIFRWQVDEDDRFFPNPDSLQFTTCGSTGNSGPTQQDCNQEYTTSTSVGTLGGVNVNNGIQQFEIPRTGNYQLKVRGAGSSSGEGAIIQGEVFLKEGTNLQIAVGQRGSTGGGNGGTFVAKGSSFNSAEPLIIAGGGANEGGFSSRANTGTSGKDGEGAGGTDGDGGAGGDGGGGGGFLTNGQNGVSGQGGFAFQNGANGGTNGGSIGGFGGGGAAEPGGDEPGGGGGYSGGGASDDTGGEDAGGGGSFVASNFTNVSTSDGTFSTTGTEPQAPFNGSVDDLSNYNTGPGEVLIEPVEVLDQDGVIVEQIQLENAFTQGDTSFITRPGLVGNQSVSVRESSDIYLETLADLRSVNEDDEPIGTFTNNETAVAFTLRSADNKSESVIMSTRTGPNSDGFEVYQSKSSTGLKNGIGVQFTDGTEEIIVETQSDNVTSRGVDRFVINIEGKDGNDWEIYRNGNQLNTQVISNGDPSFNKHERELWFGRLSSSNPRAMQGELSDIKFDSSPFEPDDISDDLQEREIVSTDLFIKNIEVKPEFGFEPIAATEDIVVEATVENRGSSQDQDYVVSEVLDLETDPFGNSSFETIPAGAERTLNLSHTTTFSDIGKTNRTVFAGTSENFEKQGGINLTNPGPFLNDERADIRQNESDPNKYFGELDYNVSTRVSFDFIDADFQFIDERDSISGTPQDDVLINDSFVNTSETTDNFNKGQTVDVQITVDDKAGNRKVIDTVAQVESDTLDVTNVDTNDPIIEGEELKVNVTVENLDRELTLTENVTVEVPAVDFNKTKEVTVGPGNSIELNYVFQSETEDRGTHSGTAEAKRESLDFQVEIQQDVFVEFFDVHFIDYDNEQIEYEYNATSRLGTIDRVEVEHRDPSTGAVLDTYVDNFPNDEAQYDNISDPMDYSGLSAGQEDIEAEVSVFTDEGLGDNQTIQRKVDEPFIIEVDNQNSKVLTDFAVDLDLNHRKEFFDDFSNIAFRQGPSNNQISEYWIEPNNFNPGSDAKIWFNVTDIQTNPNETLELRYGTFYTDENFTGGQVFRHYDGFLDDTSSEWTQGRILLNGGSGSRFIFQPSQDRLTTDTSNDSFFHTYDETDDDSLLEDEGFVSEIATRSGDNDGMAPVLLQEDVNNNTLLNPSFEQGSGTDPDNWSTAATTLRTDQESRNGTRSMLKEGSGITDTYGSEFETQNPFGVLGGAEYEFGGHYLVDLDQEDTSQYQYRFTIEWLDENRNLITTNTEANSYVPSDNETFTRTTQTSNQVDIVADSLNVTGTGTFKVETGMDSVGYIEFTNYQNSRDLGFEYTSGVNEGCNSNENGRSYGVAVPDSGGPKQRSIAMLRNSDSTDGHRVVSSTDSVIKQAYVDPDGNVCPTDQRFNASVTSINGGNFTLDVSEFRTDEVVMYRAYDLGDTGQADVGFAEVNSTGTQQETVGFDPDMVQTFTGQQITSTDQDQQFLGDPHGVSRGFANLNTGTQYSVSTSAGSGSTNAHRSSVFEGRVVFNRYLDSDANVLGTLNASLFSGPANGFGIDVEEFSFGVDENIMYSAVDLPQNANVELDNQEITSPSQRINREFPDQSRIEYIDTISAQRVGSVNTEYVSPNNGGCSNSIGMSEGWFSQDTPRGQHSLGLGRTSASMNTHRVRVSDQYILDNVYTVNNQVLCGRLQVELLRASSNSFEMLTDNYYVDETMVFMTIYNDQDRILFEAPENAEEANLIVESKEDTGSQDADIYWDDMFVETTGEQYRLLTSSVTGGDFNGATSNDDALVGWNETQFNDDRIRGSEIIDYGSQVNSQSADFVTVGMRYNGNRTIETTYEGVLQSQTFTEDNDIRVDRVGLASYSNDPRAFYQWWRARQFADQEPIATLIN